MKQYKKLYVLGDSFSTPNFCVAMRDSFWGLLAKDIGAETIFNFSGSGRSWPSIEQFLAANHNVFDDDTLVLVGIPVLGRFVLRSTDKKIDNCNCPAGVINEISTREYMIVENQVNSSKFFYDMPMLEYLNIYSQESWCANDFEMNQVNALRSIYMFSKLLTDVNYAVINLTTPFHINEEMDEARYFIEQIKLTDNHLIFENTLESINRGINKPVDYDDYSWRGHHGAVGNKYYYENALKPMLLKAGLI